ncbi:hypothetical protein GCM10027299_47400 [Larkinella ripae]
MKNAKMIASGTLKSLTKVQAQSIVGGVDLPDKPADTFSMKINEVVMKINAGSMKINAGSMKI